MAMSLPQREVVASASTAGAYTLTLVCPNRPGIVAATAGALLQAGGDITQAQQFDETPSNRFFMRVEFGVGPGGCDESGLRTLIERVGETFGMSWVLHDRNRRKRVLLLVSGQDHCLVDLLYRWRIGELPVDPVGIVSNHPQDRFTALDFGAIPFHHLPVTPQTRDAQEQHILRIVEETGADLVVLARYMQVLSDGLARDLAGRCINIHHSFLPGFKGARPYHQAFERGVKLIGATAHFVTADLDEGPIIAQDVEPITHADIPADLIRKGRDIERRVLARAVRAFCEDRVLLNAGKTVVFNA